MTVLLIGLLFVVVGTLGYMALRNAQDFSDANEIIPGVPTNAPKAWAGAHSPEARLHRRIRDAVTALRANRALDAPDLVEVRETLEREAVRVDESLIAAAALPPKRRVEPIERVAEAVELIETAVAEVVQLRGPEVGDLSAGIDRARTRAALVAEARQELLALSSSPDLDELRRKLDADGATQASPEHPPAAETDGMPPT